MPLRRDPRKSWIVIWLALSSIATQGTIAAGQVNNKAPQQNFSAEDGGMQKPVSLPAQVLDILSRDAGVSNQLGDSESKVTKPPASWFLASEIALGPTRQNDLIVEANGPLAGANVVTFWIFLRRGRNWELAFTAPAHDLRILRARSREYRQLETLRATCCKVTKVRFRFNGERYEEWAENTEDLK